MKRDFDLYVEGVGRLTGKANIDEIIDTLIDALNKLPEEEEDE